MALSNPDKKEKQQQHNSSSSGVESIKDESSCEEPEEDGIRSTTDASDTQCDAGGDEMEVDQMKKEEGSESPPASSSPVVDELENVNVREMRKIFLLPAAVGPEETERGSSSSSRLRESKSCASLVRPAIHPMVARRAAEVAASTASKEEISVLVARSAKAAEGSFVRALVMKFNQISAQPTSL